MAAPATMGPNSLDAMEVVVATPLTKPKKRGDGEASFTITANVCHVINAEDVTAMLIKHKTTPRQCGKKEEEEEKDEEKEDKHLDE